MKQIFQDIKERWPLAITVALFFILGVIINW